MFRSSHVPVLLVLLTASPLVLAGQPPKTLSTELITDGITPAAQSLGSSDGAQPVNVMNWLLDENGNLKVSKQVRDQVIPLVETPLTLAPGEWWESGWFATRAFNVLMLYFLYPGIDNCTLQWRISESIPPTEAVEAENGCLLDMSANCRYRIIGREARVRCQNRDTTTHSIDYLYVYLRAE